jgi:hypothetical protein
MGSYRIRSEDVSLNLFFLFSNIFNFFILLQDTPHQQLVQPALQFLLRTLSVTVRREGEAVLVRRAGEEETEKWISYGQRERCLLLYHFWISTWFQGTAWTLYNVFFVWLIVVLIGDVMMLLCTQLFYKSLESFIIFGVLDLKFGTHLYLGTSMDNFRGILGAFEPSVHHVTQDRPKYAGIDSNMLMRF